MVRWLTDDELERAWEEVVVAYSRYYLAIFLEGKGKVKLPLCLTN
jgi:hypothetical protein